jgi:predicted nucleic acid-binding protein
MPSATLDANVAIGLAKGNVFEHLSQLYSVVYIPAAVRIEVVDQAHGRAGVSELTAALGRWIIESNPSPAVVRQFLTPPSTADRELLAVAVEAGADHLLSGDRVVCREATARGLVCLGATQIVVLMKDQALVPEVRSVLDLMRQRGFGIAEADYQQALSAAGEGP